MNAERERERESEAFGRSVWREAGVAAAARPPRVWRRAGGILTPHGGGGGGGGSPRRGGAQPRPSVPPPDPGHGAVSRGVRRGRLGPQLPLGHSILRPPLTLRRRVPLAASRNSDTFELPGTFIAKFH